MKKRITSIILILATIFSTAFTVFANDPYSYSSEPTRAIYLVLPTMKGNDVKWVQAALNLYGNYGLEIDGSFGYACQDATRKFQASMGLEQDGSFGPITRAKMVEWLNSRGNSQQNTQSNTHTHNYQWVWYWKAHPHWNEYKCTNCGHIKTGTGNDRVTLDDCSECHPTQSQPTQTTPSAPVNNTDNPYNYSNEPTRAVYYVFPTMRGNDVKWIQCSLNLYGNYGLAIDGSFGPACRNATKKFQTSVGLSQDGSFGPITRAKMVEWLQQKGYAQSNSTPQQSSSSNITTAQIQAVLDKYGYRTGTYWTYPEGGSATSGYYSSNRYGRGFSYKYEGVECYGFANFIMHEITGTNVNPNYGNSNGWTYLNSWDVSELKIGDIVRIGKSNTNGHTGIVLTVDGSGNCTFAECWGGDGNKINIGGKLNSSLYGYHSTLSNMKNSGVLLYVYRYAG